MMNSVESNVILSNQVKTNENVRIIGLNISSVNSQIESRLLELNPVAEFFTDAKQCLDLIKSIDNEKIFIVMSYEIALNLPSLIHSLRSIIYFFIFNNDEKQEDQVEILIHKYPKIVNIYTDEDQLIKAIQEKIRHIERHYLSFDLFDQKQKSTRNLSKESASFLWHQMLVHVLKQMPQNDSAKNYMLSKCSNYYRTNQVELNKIEQFRKTYTRDKAISWYTDECFLYKLVNRALRTEDIELLYSFRFFIVDLCIELEKENEKLKNNGTIKLYRGQIISNEEFEKLEQSIGVLISTNGFFSTSRNINISLSFVHSCDKNACKSVLFQINADPSLNSVIFADIAKLGSLPHEEEVLFSLNSLFKIEQIHFDSILDLWIIEMTATNEGTDKINQYLKWIQTELDCHNPLVYFGRLLWNELGQINKAFNYFQILITAMTDDHPDVSFLYTELGNIYHEKGQYNLAMENYQKALNIRRQQIPLDYFRIASSLNNIGIVYQQQNQTNQALEYFQESLSIYNKYDEKILHKSNPLMNIGSIYRDQDDLDKALEYLTDAYNIRRHLLPNDHPLIADSLSSLGNIYHDKLYYDQALGYYQQSLTIQELIYPNDHLNKANTIRNIGLIYQDKKQWNEALNYLNRSLEIRQNILLNNNHMDIAVCFGDIGNTYENMKQYDLAFDYYQKRLSIEEKCLSLDHSLVSSHFELILNLLIKSNQLNQALELCRKKLTFLQDSFGNEYENHSSYARTLISLANLLEKYDFKQAEKYYQQALSILMRQNNYEEIQICFDAMTNFYSKLNKFDKALNCQFQLLDIQRSTISSDQKSIAYTLRRIARLNTLNKTFTPAMIYFQQSLDILQTIFRSDHDDIKQIQYEIDQLNKKLSTENDFSTEINDEDISFKARIPDYYTVNTSIMKPVSKAAMRPNKSSSLCILQ